MDLDNYRVQRKDSYTDIFRIDIFNSINLKKKLPAKRYRPFIGFRMCYCNTQVCSKLLTNMPELPSFHGKQQVTSTLVHKPNKGERQSSFPSRPKRGGSKARKPMKREKLIKLKNRS